MNNNQLKKGKEELLKFGLGLIMFILFSVAAKAQSVAVVNFDAINVGKTNEEVGNIARIEVEKLGTFSVIDKYEMKDVFAANRIDINSCFGRTCLSRIGAKLNVNYVLTGTVEKMETKIVVSIRKINVTSKSIEKTTVSEFVYSPGSMERYIQMALYKMFDKQIDQKLVEIYDYKKYQEGQLEGPNIKRLNLSGPRFGVSYQDGNLGSILSDPTYEGGFNVQPFMTSFGYHFEFQYLSSKNFQALFETVGLVNGLDQQQFIPSISLLNGFRNTKYGWEIGFGPTFRLKKTAMGYYDESGAWKLSGEAPLGTTINEVERLDSRGTFKLNTAWVWAVGKNFQFGKLNMPVNIYVIPNKDGMLYGFSMGYSLQR